MNQDHITLENTIYCLVIVTSPEASEAEAIAHALLAAKLAACVSITQTNSLYTWKGKIESSHEYQLTIKTKKSKFSLVRDLLKRLHSYEVPEIIAIPIINGDQAYLDWIEENVSE